MASSEPHLPLSRHPFVRTFDMDEANQLYGRLNTRIRSEMIDRRTPFAWHGNAVRIGSLHVGANAYGGSARSRTDTVAEAYSMTFALGATGGEGSDGRSTVTVEKDRTAWLCSPLMASAFHYGTFYRGLNVTIPRPLMEDTLAVLTGAPPREVLQFDSKLSLSGAGGSVQRLARLAADEVDRESTSFSSPIVADRFVDSILFAMLLGQPNNYSRLLERAPTGPGPQHVQRAAEYLTANAHRPIRIRDLTELTGVSARALQAGFLKHHGRSPMEFLRDRRLELARTRLATRSSSSVAQIARESGFLHLGRFSADYRARFGESPSATRAKAG